MLKINQHKRNVVSSFLAGIYVLLMLFATNFHEHHHSSFKNVEAQKFQKQFASSHDDISSSDCWSCHFLGNHQGIIPQEFNFSAFNPIAHSDLEIKKSDAVVAISLYNYLLRGPPSFQVL